MQPQVEVNKSYLQCKCYRDTDNCQGNIAKMWPNLAPLENKSNANSFDTFDTFERAPS